MGHPVWLGNALDGGDGVGFDWFRFGVWFGWAAFGAWAVAQVVHVAVEEALAFFARGWDFGDGRDGALDGIDFEFFDLEDLFGLSVAGLLWQVDGGDAEGAEEQFDAVVVDLVPGEAAAYLADGQLDGGAVEEVGKVEGGVARDVSWAGRLAAGEVVVVAEIFVAERWAVAAVSRGVDVAADVAWCGLCVLHCVYPPMDTVVSCDLKAKIFRTLG
jgi:hypothetical protein